MLKLKVLNRSLCLLHVYAPNVKSEYQSTVRMGDFNAHVGIDTGTVRRRA